MNNNRILIRRGENDKLIDSEDLIAFGQPVYNKDLNYLSIGTFNLEGTTRVPLDYKNLKPIRVRELFGYFKDSDSLTPLDIDADKFNIFGENGVLNVFSSRSMNIKTGSGNLDKLVLDSSKTEFTGYMIGNELRLKYLKDKTGELYLDLAGNIELYKPLTTTSTITLQDTAVDNILNNANFGNNIKVKGNAFITDTLTANKDLIINGDGVTEALKVNGKSAFNNTVLFKDNVELKSNKFFKGQVGNNANRNAGYFDTLSNSGTTELNNTVINIGAGKTVTVKVGQTVMFKIDEKGKVSIKNAEIENLVVKDLDIVG